MKCDTFLDLLMMFKDDQHELLNVVAVVFGIFDFFFLVH